jgi:hypothetical protein
MDSNFLQGIGLLLCIGAIVVVALVAFAARALMGNRNRQQDQTMWNTRGSEQPQYDDPNVESRGGFGGMPATGQQPPRTGPSTGTQSGFGAPGNRPVSRPPAGGPPAGGAQSYDQDRSRDQPKRVDDDDVRSSGGFGGG